MHVGQLLAFDAVSPFSEKVTHGVDLGDACSLADTSKEDIAAATENRLGIHREMNHAAPDVFEVNVRMIREAVIKGLTQQFLRVSDLLR